jgi:chromosome segregation ATPase
MEITEVTEWVPETAQVVDFHMTKKRKKPKGESNRKSNFFKKSLEQMPPGDDWKRQGMLMKINRLEGRLIRWDAISDKKMCKRKQKEEKKWDKKLTPEALSQLQTLKSQIATLKPVLYQLKVTKKGKKSELELALQTGQGDKENIWSEILRLKESIHETQKQISSFKEQIQAIRG